MKHAQHHRESGFSLLESSISLGISASVILLAATVVRYTTHMTSQYLRSYQGRAIAEKTFAILEAAVRLSEHHRLPIGVTIATSPPPLVRALPLTSRPRPGSHLLTVMHVDPFRRSRVLTSTLSDFAGSVTLEACQRWNHAANPDIRGYLLVGLRGVAHVVGGAIPHDKTCFTLSGTVTERFGVPLRTPFGSPLEVLPVINTYTFFIDATGQLRLVSHVGGRILENQPIVSGLRTLSISQLTTTDGGVAYTFTVRPSLSKPLSYTTILGITRRSFISEALS